MNQLWNHTGVNFGVVPNCEVELAYELRILSDGTQITGAREGWGTKDHHDLTPQVREQIAQYLVLAARRLLVGPMPDDMAATFAINPNGRRLDPDEYLKGRY